MRLIEADELQTFFNEVSTGLLRKPALTKDAEHIVRASLMVTEMIQDAPTIDAVEVVRCKDCDWWTKQDDSAQGRCARYGFYPTGYYYCAGGERGRP